MRIRTARLRTALLAGAAIALTGCGAAGTPTPGAVEDGSLARVREAGTLLVCSSNDVPYFYRDPRTGQLVGTDHDMVKAIGDRLGIPQVEMYEVPISGIIPALNARRCDLIADNIAITVKRSQEVAFSAPMYRAGQALVVPTGNPGGVRSEADFAGHRIGSYQGTVQLDYLKGLATKDPRIQVQEYKNITEIVADLEAGRLDAGAFDDMVAAAMIKTNPGLRIEIVDYALPIGDYTVGAAFRKEDRSLRTAFDDAHRELMQDGTLNRIFATWGMSPAEDFQPFPGCCAAPSS